MDAISPEPISPLAKADALAAAREFAAAEAAYRIAAEHDPDRAEAHLKLGNLLLRLGRAEAALPALRRAATLDPDSALIHCHLGLALQELREPAEAALALEQALRLRPDFPEALGSLAEAWRKLGRLDEARNAAERAIARDFTQPEAHLALGNVFGDLGEFVLAANAYRRVLGLRPRDATAISNLGIALYELGHFPESIAQHRAALAVQPDSPAFRYNLSVALLANGELDEGWDAYEARLDLDLPSILSHEVRAPRWNGEPLAGRTILLYGEQGLGDTLQFVRYAPLVAERGGRVLLGVPQPLVRLLTGLPDVAEVLPAGVPVPPFDVHCPLLSLPRVFGTTLDSIPAAIPYLAADPALIAAWRGRIHRNGGRNVGLVWAGNPRPDQPWAAVVDRRRSMPLARFAPLAGIPGVRYVSLQKGPPAEQLADPPPGLSILDPMGAIEDFADTAALLAHIDLIVTVDTSVAHLAGALGKPVWMLSRHDACWRWLRDRDDSPWYPTMRIYRQQRPGDWDGVIAVVAADLRRWAVEQR